MIDSSGRNAGALPFRRGAFLDEQTCRMICPIAAAMVGVCLTGISLLHVGIALSRNTTLADDFLSIDAVLFLIATLTSYFALRGSTVRRLARLERIADAAFISAMAMLTAICIYITYAISV